MAVLNLNLYRHPSGLAFDPRKVVQKLAKWFPEATFAPGDQAAAEVERAKSFFARELQADPESPARKVVESLRRKARNYGPSYAFVIPLEDGGPIRGCARSVGVTFLSEGPLREPTRTRLIEFLKSLGVGRIEVSTGDQRQFEVLYDLRGESDCLRPDVPWNHEASVTSSQSPETP